MKNAVLIAAIAGLATSGAAYATALSFGTPYTPGTPAGPRTLQTSWSGLLDAASPTYRRTGQSPNTSETAPNTPNALAGTAASLYRYGVQSFTPTSSGLYEFFSAQAFDGFLFLYNDPFNPASALTNVLAGDDDMAVLNGGAVPNRNAVPTTNDSGFQFNLVGGNTYQIVTTTFTAASIPANGNYYNEIYLAGTPAVPAAPSFAIPDNNIPGVNIDLVITDSSVIQSFDSIELLDMSHSWVGDLIVTLTHLESGTSVVLMNQEGGASNSSDLGGSYTLVDGGAAWPVSAGLTAPGTFGSDGALSDFAGLSLAGTWRLNVSDRAGSDTGRISAFRINVTVPTPGAMALLGLGGLVAARRRRA